MPDQNGMIVPGDILPLASQEPLNNYPQIGYTQRFHGTNPRMMGTNPRALLRAAIAAQAEQARQAPLLPTPVEVQDGGLSNGRPAVPDGNGANPPVPANPVASPTQEIEGRQQRIGKVTYKPGMDPVLDPLRQPIDLNTLRYNKPTVSAPSPGYGTMLATDLVNSLKGPSGMGVMNILTPMMGLIHGTRIEGGQDKSDYLAKRAIAAGVDPDKITNPAVHEAYTKLMEDAGVPKEMQEAIVKEDHESIPDEIRKAAEDEEKQSGGTEAPASASAPTESISEDSMAFPGSVDQYGNPTALNSLAAMQSAGGSSVEAGMPNPWAPQATPGPAQVSISPNAQMAQGGTPHPMAQRAPTAMQGTQATNPLAGTGIQNPAVSTIGATQQPQQAQQGNPMQRAMGGNGGQSKLFGVTDPTTGQQNTGLLTALAHQTITPMLQGGINGMGKMTGNGQYGSPGQPGGYAAPPQGQGQTPPPGQQTQGPGLIQQMLGSFQQTGNPNATSWGSW